LTGIAKDAGRATRKEHVALFAAGKLQLVYAGWANLGTTAPHPLPIRVKASIEYPAGNYLPVHFHDETADGFVTIPAGANVTSLACEIAIPSGAKFFTNTSVIPSTGGTYPIGRDHGAVAFNPPDSCTLDTTSDYTLSRQPDSSPEAQYCYIPLAICGVPELRSGKSPVVGIIGDSIAQGVGSSVIPSTAEEVGIVQQACQRAGIGYVNLAINNSNAAHWALYLAANPSLLEVLSASSDVVVIIGSNDLFGYRLGLASAPHLIANLQKIWDILATQRIRIWQATIPPKTHSTDNYRTLANQSPWNPNFGPEANGGSPWSVVNAFIRKIPAPLTGIIDLAAKAAVLNDRFVYVWRPGTTSDGTHPIPGAGNPDFVSLVPVKSFG